MAYNHEEDGKTHVNIYSQGKTSLGRFLSNFTQVTMATEDGYFESVEGYWYWLGADPENPDRDKLRNMHGFRAKEFGRALHKDKQVKIDGFEDKIKAAITIKMQNSPTMWAQLTNNKLPLAHYYVYGGKVVEPHGNEWLIDHFRDLSRERLIDHFRDLST